MLLRDLFLKIFSSVHLILCMSALLECMHVCHTHAWCPTSDDSVISPWSGVLAVMSHHSPRKQTWVLWKSNTHSQLQCQLSSSTESFLPPPVSVSLSLSCFFLFCLSVFLSLSFSVLLRLLDPRLASAPDSPASPLQILLDYRCTPLTPGLCGVGDQARCSVHTRQALHIQMFFL